jgi:hypothetical protein
MNGNNMNNAWFFVMISQSNASLLQILYYTSSTVTPAVSQIAFTNTWAFDSTFKVELGGTSNDLIFFNGVIARATLVLDFYSNSVTNLNPYRYGIPRKLIRAKNHS